VHQVGFHLLIDPRLTQIAILHFPHSNDLFKIRPPVGMLKTGEETTVKLTLQQTATLPENDTHCEFRWGKHGSIIIKLTHIPSFQTSPCTAMRPMTRRRRPGTSGRARRSRDASESSSGSRRRKNRSRKNDEKRRGPPTEEEADEAGDETHAYEQDEHGMCICCLLL
jgi:hypothetical protein